MAAAVPDPIRVDRRTFRAAVAVLRRAARDKPRPFLVSIVGAAVFGAMTVAASVVLGAVTDRVLLPAFESGRADIGALVGAAAAILGVATAKAAGIVGRRVGASAMQLGLHARYRRAVTRRYLELPLAWHRRHSTGELLSNANADVEAAFAPIAPLPFSLGVGVMFICVAVVLLTTDLLLAAVGLAVLPLVALASWAYNRRVVGPARRAQEARAQTSGIAHESFDGALVVKVLGIEAAETERFRAASDLLRDELVRLGRVRAVFNPLIDILPQFAIMALILVGVHRIRAGVLTPGELVQFAYLFTLLAVPVRIFGYLLEEMPRSVVGWERVARVLDAPDQQRYGTVRLPVGDGPAQVALDGVAFGYRGADGSALDGIDLRPEPGKVLALVGPTGAGKSTLVALLSRLADPDAGVVRLDGEDLRSLAEGEVPAHVAVAFQSTFLFDDSVRANVTLGAEIDDAEVFNALEVAQATTFVEALPDGLDTHVGERGYALSGGQRQRLALARAVVRGPRLLVLDDATSSVDAVVEAAILRRLRAAALGATVVLVAYRRASIALADAVVYVVDGRVVATGTHEVLVRTVPGYAALLATYETAAPADESAA